jgi:transcriptional regulator with XRE-family HTH domain
VSETEKKSGNLTAFGKHCRKIRNEYGLTPEQVAGKMGISASMLSQVEYDKKPLTWKFLWKAVNAYDELGCDEKDTIYPLTTIFQLAYEALSTTETLTFNFADIQNLTYRDNLFRFFAMLLLDQKYPIDGWESGKECMDWIYPCRAIEALEKDNTDASHELVFAREQRKHKLDTVRETAIEETSEDIAIRLIKMGLNDEQIAAAVGLTSDKIVFLRQNTMI